ncbi:hypothetical protein [Nocardioides sp.]|uniref:hypothetical protein n=1 Tax=Nocardioides sp. TaxID=35761 RepID=UPI002B269BF8|nr:hypothetical protein [Nocardioides sp.]
MQARSDRVILHVGTMKSGTSYLQALIFAEKQRLAASGVHVPGKTWGVQSRAIQQAIGIADTERTVWERMIADVAAHRGGPSIISMEFLAPVKIKRATRIVQELGGDVDVVFTVRDLNRTLVSMWQETIQNGRSWTWEDYHREVAANAPGAEEGVHDRASAAGSFWRQQHVVRLVRDWSEIVGSDRVSLVTVPQPGADRSELARRFGEATGVDFGTDPVVKTANESLGLASILALRRLNEQLDEAGVTSKQIFRLRKRVLAKTVLAARRSLEPSLGLAVEDWVVEQTRHTVAALAESGVRLIGDLADLDPVAVKGIQPSEVDEQQIGEAALAGLAGLIQDLESSS